MRALLMLLVLLPFGACADDTPPDVLVRDTVREVLEIVQRDGGVLADQRRLLELVDAKVLPHFDFARMTRLAVGRAWRTATPEQQQALTAQFRTLLVRTYTKVFTTYRDPKVEVRPLQLAADAKEATVQTVISVTGKTAKVDYEMGKTPTGWKAFDVTVEGVSLVTSYRGSFADEIQQHGVDGLIAKLAEANRNAAANASRAQAK
ncbi:MAG: ABC transporter substrate-binding protein [Sideroxydans sp.]